MSAIPKQDIRFCKTADGVTIAYSTMGQGFPLLIPPQLVTHLEADLIEGPLAEVYEVLSQHLTVIRLDKRGTGLSERDASDYSSDESFVSDIEAVVDALGLPKFAMYGFSAGGRLALHYYAKHPDRVSHLIFYGTTASAADEERRKTRDIQLAVGDRLQGMGRTLDAVWRLPGRHRANRSLATALCDRRWSYTDEETHCRSQQVER